MKAFLENEGNFTDKDITLLNERMNPVINGKISFEDFRNEIRPPLYFWLTFSQSKGYFVGFIGIAVLCKIESFSNWTHFSFSLKYCS